MNKLILINLFGLLSFVSHAQVSDTLGFPDYLEGTETLYESPNGGYAFGNNGYGDKAKVQSFRHDQSYVIREVLLKFGAVEFNSGDSTSSVAVNIYSFGGAGVTLSSVSDSTAPDTIVASVDIPVYQLLADGSLTAADFSSDTIVMQANQQFFAGISFDGLANVDTIGLFSTTDEDADGANEAWEFTSAGNWVVIAQPAYSWDLDVDLAIFTTIDVNDPADVFETDRSASIDVYPNPFTDVLFLENLDNDDLANGQIAVYDAFGKQVLLSDARKGDNRIDLSIVPNGVYTISIIGETSVVSKRIIKAN